VKLELSEPCDELVTGNELPAIDLPLGLANLRPLLGRQVEVVHVVLPSDRDVDRRSVGEIDVAHAHLAFLHLRCEPQHHASRVAQPRTRYQQLVRQRKHAISLGALSALAAMRTRFGRAVR